MDEVARPRLVVVVKYHPPLRRVSGIIGSIVPLLQRLANSLDVHVVTHRAGQPGPSEIPWAGYRVHRVRGFFAVAAALQVRYLSATACGPVHVLLVSGVYDLRQAVPYWGLFRALLGAGRSRPDHLGFLQATHSRQDPPDSMRRLLASFDNTLCVGNVMTRRFANAGIAADDFHPGVDIEGIRRHADQVSHSLLPETMFRVGFVNHFTHVKGADVAATVFAELSKRRSDIGFVLAGTGPLDEEVRLIASTGRNIHVMGYLDVPERMQLLASLDVIVLPVRSEVSVLGVAQTVLEAMALETVVVGSDVPAVSSAIVDGVEGVIVDDVDDYARAIESLLDDAPRRLRLSGAALGRVTSEFDLTERVYDLLRLTGISSNWLRAGPTPLGSEMCGE